MGSTWISRLQKISTFSWFYSYVVNRTTQAGLHSQAEYGPAEEAGFLFQAADWPQRLDHPDAAFSGCWGQNPHESQANCSECIRGGVGGWWQDSVFTMDTWLATLGMKWWNRWVLGLSQDVSYIFVTQELWEVWTSPPRIPQKHCPTGSSIYILLKTKGMSLHNMTKFGIELIHFLCVRNTLNHQLIKQAGFT